MTPISNNPIARCHVVVLMSSMLLACTGQMASPQVNREAEPVFNTVVVDAEGIPAAGGIGQARFGERARAYLEQRRAEYGILDVPGELVFKNETVDQLNHKHVRFQQVKNGVPVYGHELIVHFNQRDEGVRVSGSFLAALGQLDVRPRVTAEEAAAAAISLKGASWGVAKTQLWIYRYERRPRLAYQLTLTRGLERWLVFVDAQDGTVLHQVTGMYNAMP